MMEARLKLTKRGQLIIGKRMLAHMELRPGEGLIADTSEPGSIRIRPAPRASIEAFFGCLKNDEGLHFTIEELNEAISDAWAGKR